MHELDCKAVVDIRKDQMIVTEDTFNVNSSCDYGTKGYSVRHLT